MALKTCPECGYKTELKRRQCPNCGNRDFDKESTYQTNNEEQAKKITYKSEQSNNFFYKSDSKAIENDNYKNEIACKLKDWADGLFVVSIIIGIILIIIFLASLEDFSSEYEKIHNYSNLYYGILFIIIAPIEKLLLHAKAEQIELLHQINNKMKD